jgi:hypothetical protein
MELRAPKKVNMDAPPTPEELEIVCGVCWQARRTRSGSSFVVFRYQGGWGPSNQLHCSSWYHSKEEAARAIFLWAPNDWMQRVVAKSLPSAPPSPPQLPLPDNEATEHCISCSIRDLRCHLVDHWKRTIPKDRVAADPTGQVLGAHIEDDRLSNELMRKAATCTPEEWDDILELATKVETDCFEGPVIHVGPIGLSVCMDKLRCRVPCVQLETLRRNPCPLTAALVLDKGHWIPFWSPTAHRSHQSRSFGTPLCFQEFTDVAGALGCHCDPTTRASGDCGFHALGTLQSLCLALKPHVQLLPLHPHSHDSAEEAGLLHSALMCACSFVCSIQSC